MLETNTLLVNCPQCGAWPMAASRPKQASGPQDLRFRRPKCRHEERGWLRRTAASQQRSDRNAA
jgi:hypothetical protein